MVSGNFGARSLRADVLHDHNDHHIGNPAPAADDYTRWTGRPEQLRDTVGTRGLPATAAKPTSVLPRRQALNGKGAPLYGEVGVHKPDPS
jgi:hypothetical protein